MLEVHVALHDGALTFQLFQDSVPGIEYTEADALARYQAISADPGEESEQLEYALVRTKRIADPNPTDPELTGLLWNLRPARAELVKAEMRKAVEDAARAAGEQR